MILCDPQPTGKGYRCSRCGWPRKNKAPRKFKRQCEAVAQPGGCVHWQGQRDDSLADHVKGCRKCHDRPAHDCVLFGIVYLSLSEQLAIDYGVKGCRGCDKFTAEDTRGE